MRLSYFFILFLLGVSEGVFAQESSYSNEVQRPASVSDQGYQIDVARRQTRRGSLKRTRMRNQARLARALELIQNRNYLEGVRSLFELSTDNRFKNQLPEIKFILGKTFMELGLFQAASFQFVSILQTNNREYSEKSLRHLSKISSVLGDKTILEFAIQKGGVQKLKGSHRDSFYYQFGKLHLKNRERKKAINYLKRIPRSSEFYTKARYNIGLAYAEQNKVKSSIRSFNDIIEQTSYSSNPIRVAALMGKARVYFQSKKWGLALSFYRQVPKDSPNWYDTLLEQSWTLLHAGKFRSAMNGFHTLHSSYYINRYQPESFILRAIVYMYICKYDEMEKTLSLFKVAYEPIKDWVNKQKNSRRNYYRDIIRSVQKNEGSFPRAIALRIYRENDFRLLHKYIEHLDKEAALIQSYPLSWRGSAVGQYSSQMISARKTSSLKQVNRIVKTHLNKVQLEMKNFFEQEKFLRYEGIRGKRKELQKKISNKYLGNIKSVENKSRDYFVQNGFEFWPFNGEHWIDELGNYHYVGMQNCR